MSTEATQGDAPHDKERIDAIATPADLPADAQRIGTDGKGTTHYHSRAHTSVYVFDTETDELLYSWDDIRAGGPLLGWVDDMADKRGWESLNLYDSFPEAFVAQLEATTDTEAEQ